MTNTHFSSVFPLEDAIPERWNINTPIDQQEYLCDGIIKKWKGRQREVVSPICEVAEDGVQPKLIGSTPMLGQTESLEILEAACRTFDNGRGVWPTMSVEERIRSMEVFAIKITEKREQVVKLLMWEIGKTLPDSEKEFDRTVTYIRDTIDALKDLDRVSSRFVITQEVIGQIRRAPLGVALCMGPYNYPLNETFTTLIPALLMGNSVIFKPPKLGLLLFQPLLEAFQEAFPPGVINTVYGEGQTVISPIIASGRVDVLAFIGTSQVADSLRKQHPKPHRLRCVLGLEAKNPGIILKDADLDLAVKECILGSLSFNGQRCTALKIIFVHKDVVEAFLSKFSDAVDSLKAGMPWEEGVFLTPLPIPNKTDYLTSLIEDARLKGAHVVNQNGGQVDHTFMSPAVMYPVGPGMRLYLEEQFGPVIPIVPFSDINEPMNYIIQSNYGQQVSLFGEDPRTIADLIDPLVNQVCRVNINSQCQRGPDIFPFTGRKDSAEGTLSVSDALRVFSIRTLVAAKETDANKTILKSILTQRSSRFLNTDFIL